MDPWRSRMDPWVPYWDINGDIYGDIMI